ncbi:MAG: hypothetical protein KF757_00460 [Phycisphaeraceae bacterium]|nr:hypothetical protein [Phycisphaeraceae bacterium]MCW5761679.1 hypothetical protein [Phycisphaeraceae bacterium]
MRVELAIEGVGAQADAAEDAAEACPLMIEKCDSSGCMGDGLDIERGVAVGRRMLGSVRHRGVKTSAFSQAATFTSVLPHECAARPEPKDGA